MMVKSLFQWVADEARLPAVLGRRMCTSLRQWTRWLILN